MDTIEYIALDDSNLTWLCNHCGLLNISPSALLSFNRSQSSLHNSTIGSPIHTSSPIRSNPPIASKSSLKIINVNCQSLRAKQEAFKFLIAREDPDIILGTESWLSSTITSSECFPTDTYNIERRDRPSDPHGGVFIAAKKCLKMKREPSYETNCEIVWCKLEIRGNKSINIASYYRPHENDEASLEELDSSLSRLQEGSHTIIVETSIYQAGTGPTTPSRSANRLDCTSDSSTS
jgi:hypothetical protein